MRLLAFSLLALSLTTLSACSSVFESDKDQSTPQKDDGPLKLTDYFSFLGIEYGDSFAKVEQSFGKPLNWSDDPEYDFTTARYYENEHNIIAPLSFSKWRANDAIMSITVRLNGKDYLTRDGKGADKRLQVLGMSRDAALALFGTPIDQSPFGGSGNSWLSYDIKSNGGRRMHLMLFCARPPETTPCDQLRVQWLGTDEP